jgi:hypothetical protein
METKKEFVELQYSKSTRILLLSVLGIWASEHP